MGIAAAQIGLDHQPGERFRILGRQARRDESAGDKSGKIRGGNARSMFRTWWSCSPVGDEDWFNAAAGS